MTHLFDTSALLAFYFDEVGAEDVSALLAGGRAQNGVCCVSGIEFWSRLRHLGADSRYAAEWAEIETMASMLPVTTDVMACALEIRHACERRIPTVDLLIAATAAQARLTLVHRDPHFLAIPESILQQRFVGGLV